MKILFNICSFLWEKWSSILYVDRIYTDEMNPPEADKFKKYLEQEGIVIDGIVFKKCHDYVLIKCSSESIELLNSSIDDFYNSQK